MTQEDPDWWGYWADHQDKNVDNGDIEDAWAKAIDRVSKRALYLVLGLAVICLCCLCGAMIS